MIEALLSVYFAGCVISFLLLAKFASNSATPFDLIVGAIVWPATALFGYKEWLSK